MAHTSTGPRRRASDDPGAQERWARVWLDGDKREAFKVEGAPVHPIARRRWFGRLL